MRLPVAVGIIRPTDWHTDLSNPAHTEFSGSLSRTRANSCDTNVILCDITVCTLLLCRSCITVVSLQTAKSRA